MSPQQVVIVTGGAMGIGRAIVERFASDGAAVVIADVSGAAAAAEELTGGGATAIGVYCDVSAPESLTQKFS